MANKVSAADYGSSAPKIEPDDLEDDAAILTVTTFETVMVDDEDAKDGKRKSATLKFEETGDKVLWLNKGMMETLIEQLGDDAEKWEGQKVPVEKHIATFGNKKFPKVRVMPSEEWDAAFKAAGVRRPKPSAKK